MRRLLIDTDCGTDDACAILLAVRYAQKEPDVKIEAITTCHGNVELAKVRPNVLRVLQLCGAADIPVYEGASRPLVEPMVTRASSPHGNDGFGGMSDYYPAPEIPVPEEHAVLAMIRLARHFRDEITVVALGPPTNIALAQKLDSEFLSNLKKLVVMGGSCFGSGNDSRLGADFNFGCDPEALSIVVNETTEAGKLEIVTMDACRNYPLKWSWFDSLDKTNKFMRFFKDVMGNAVKRYRAVGHPGLFVYDMAAMAVCLEPAIAASTVVCPIYAELHGQWSRGYIVLDRRPPDRWDRRANAHVCSALDTDRLESLYNRML